MKTRIRTASVAVAVLVIGLSAATAGCGKYSFSNLKAMKAFKEANDHYRASALARGRRPLRSCDRGQPNTEAAPDFLAAYFFLGNSYDNLWKPARKGEAENDAFMTKAIENYTKAAELSKDPLIKRRAHGIPRRRLRARQAERPVPGRADRPEDDSDGPERADGLLPAVEDLRGCRPLRGGRSGPPEGPRRPAERPDGLELDRRLLQPPGRLREDDGGLQQGGRARAEQPAGLPPDRQLLSGEGVEGLPADAGAEARVERSRASRPRTRRWRSTRTTSRRWSTRTSCSASRRNLEKDPAKQKELLSQADELRNKAMELQKGGAAASGQAGASRRSRRAEARRGRRLRVPGLF